MTSTSATSIPISMSWTHPLWLLLLLLSLALTLSSSSSLSPSLPDTSESISRDRTMWKGFGLGAAHNCTWVLLLLLLLLSLLLVLLSLLWLLLTGQGSLPRLPESGCCSVVVESSIIGPVFQVVMVIVMVVAIDSGLCISNSGGVSAIEAVKPAGSEGGSLRASSSSLKNTGGASGCHLEKRQLSKAKGTDVAINVKNTRPSMRIGGNGAMRSPLKAR
mmetsp:Transcript_66652/g.139155  ORF Transcript_66652/g.139155 Transcript_66652/m.139155 type:complete len:218 (+) Transcript_66652:314-967(+)